MNIDTKQLVSAEIECAAKLNFACHQNYFPVLRALKIQNLSNEEALKGLKVTLEANPSFLTPKFWHFDKIEPGACLSVSDRSIELNGNFLMQIADSMRGSLILRVERGEEILCETSKEIELLAYNEWGGANYMPELLPAFALPNDSSIDRLLKRASLILERAGKSGSIDGYQSRSRQRVWEIASAIYTAIANLRLSYSEPPASFEMVGQKIRLPGQLMKGQIGTCLDLVMLFSSALEQAGLNPIIALPKGHAMVGVWLQPETLSTVVIEDAETLRKRVQLNELVLFETTCVTTRPSPSFSKAIKVAESNIEPALDDSFLAAIDIKRARMHRILPIGLQVRGSDVTSDESQQEEVDLSLEEAPLLPKFDTEIEEDSLPDTPEGRVEKWQRKLLDLTLRNPLLHHRASTTSLKILVPNPGILEDKLAAGIKISIQSIPKPTSIAQDEELHRQKKGEAISEEYAREALENKQVLVDLPEDELTRRAVQIYRKAQTSLQEGGANTLYLALGFLLWKRDEEDNRRFRAPLILTPVTLERKSVRSGVKMVAHDDEPRFNTTLLEMLRKDFGVDIKGLDAELPADHSGVDVDGIWNIVRHAIKEVPGFEVVEDVVLGHFSFAKYLMWKDLVDRIAMLKENSVVKHLIDTPRDPYRSEIGFVRESEIDKEYAPSELFTPLPADASQMSAIATADRGKDFVVIGPPGTGKSQTIANMISHLLAKKKTVLFVSEKTAALEVVHRRLADIGLGKFCLQLHSNKARKSDVLEQLRICWDSTKSKSISEWTLKADKLRQLRDRLNSVVNHLHRRGSNGLTPFHAIGVTVKDEDLVHIVSLSWPSASQHSEQLLNKMRETVDRLAIQAEAIGQFSETPFGLIDSGEWSPQWEDELIRSAGKLSARCSSLEKAYREFLEAIGLELSDYSFSKLEALSELAQVLIESYRTESAYSLAANGVEQIEALELAVSRLKAYAELQASLSCSYDPMAWRSIDGREIESRSHEANNSWLFKKMYLNWKLVRDMRGKGALGKPDPIKDAPLLSKLRQLGEEIDNLDQQLSQFKDWKAHSTDPAMAQNLQSLGLRLRKAVSNLVDDTRELIDARAKIRNLLIEGNDLLDSAAPVGRAAENLRIELKAFSEGCTEFESFAGKSIRERFSDSDNVTSIIRDSVEKIANRHKEIREWCAWRKRRAEAVDFDLLPLVEAIESDQVSIAEIRETFEASYCKWWSSAIIGEDEVLRTFSTPEHEADIKSFRDLDDRFMKLTADYVVASLSGNIPEQEDIDRSSQWGVLQREIRKKTRHKPIRQLAQEIPEVLTTLAPCLMMSPLSVAQYLPPEQRLFDVVIFDEASQITVWDAVGSIARGKQVIVAGDPKQMPPTNFFGRSDNDEDQTSADEGDLESILDELLGASIPEQQLNLHYRSRKESLIAFSNFKYYDNCLVTFPAPLVPDKGVKLVQSDGFYARGGARNNLAEARAITKEVVRRLTHEDEEIRNASIGVVTFNSEQQSLILDLLDKERSKNSEIEWAFSNDHVLEPVFVKNLETVQGDERDVILFSITYGPDQSGHITMNFGPLNKPGGERRLNVAMTRARSEMVVFSTLRPEQIDLSRSKARAVADIKHFLEYAERGPNVLGSFIQGPIGDYESPFEIAVARSLKEKGWQVHPQIGVSAYRIDLGIVHEDHPGVYLAGIECDGAAYHSSAYARERDKIRQAVLENLGWKLLRVWSTDWWNNKAKALDSLHQKLSILLQEDRNERSKASMISSMADHQTNNTDDKLSGEMHIRNNIDTKDAQGISTFHGVTSYSYSDLDSLQISANPDAFYESTYESCIVNMILHVLEVEGPIHEDLLVKRIARYHEFSRAGNKIRKKVIDLAKKSGKMLADSSGRFFWHSQKGIENVARYRNRDDELRNIDLICSKEIKAINLALELGGDPNRFAKAIGISRLNKSNKIRIERILGSEKNGD